LGTPSACSLELHENRVLWKRCGNTFACTDIDPSQPQPPPFLKASDIVGEHQQPERTGEVDEMGKRAFGCR
jgi:hypothetical protein